MFDYANADIRAWPGALPFGSRHTELLGVVWGVEEGDRVCDAFIEHSPLDGEATHWRFRALSPLSVIVSDDERQETSLWRRRDKVCAGAEGFLLVKNSPIVAALLKYEPHVQHFTTGVEHFVLGTDWAVAHILCADVPALNFVSSPPKPFEFAQ